jgi:hypothetical protein
VKYCDRYNILLRRAHSRLRSVLPEIHCIFARVGIYPTEQDLAQENNTDGL